MPDRNTIARELTDEDLEKFLAALVARKPGERRLRDIREMAAEHGIRISLESARSFRNTTFEKHLQRIAHRKEKAGHIAQLVGDGSGRTINEAALGIMAEKIFDELNAEDDSADIAGELGSSARTPLDVERMGDLALAASRIQKSFGEVDRVKALLVESEAKVRAFEVREKERVEKARAAEKALEKLRDPEADLSEKERAAIVATVDEVLGIRVKKKE